MLLPADYTGLHIMLWSWFFCKVWGAAEGRMAPTETGQSTDWRIEELKAQCSRNRRLLKASMQCYLLCSGKGLQPVIPHVSERSLREEGIPGTMLTSEDLQGTMPKNADAVRFLCECLPHHRFCVGFYPGFQGRERCKKVPSRA